MRTLWTELCAELCIGVNMQVKAEILTPRLWTGKSEILTVYSPRSTAQVVRSVDKEHGGRQPERLTSLAGQFARAE